MKNLILPTCLLTILCAFSSSVSATDFTVNTTTDELDANFSDGICDVDLATPGEQCTLRSAILESGVSESYDTIGFSVTGEITLTNGVLIMFSSTVTDTEGLTLNGPGANSLVINANQQSIVLFDNTFGSTSINGVTITGGAPGQFTGGGGIFKFGGTLSLSNVSVTGNTATFGGGGVAFASGTLVVTNSTISNNEAGFGGGLSLGNGTSVTISNSTISGNTATETFGGGVFYTGILLNISDSIISGNAAENGLGGGIFAGNGSFSFGISTIVNSTISSNTASCGGGITNDIGDNNSSLSIISSTLRDNVANGSPDSFGCGGGMFNDGILKLTNSTISGNQVLSGDFNGGGVSNFSTVTINSSTIANNLVVGSNSGGGVFSSTGVTLGNTIIAANQNNALTADVRGFFNSLGGNLIGNVGTFSVFFESPGDQVGGNGDPIIDPLLGPLANNGGPTATHALLSGSPAIDAGRNSIATEAFDQRGQGFSRIVDGNSDGSKTVDTGAFEVQVTPAQMIEGLIALVESYNLHHGIENALIAKLNAALQALAAGNVQDARDSIRAFTNQVRAQNGKAISQPRAAELTSRANEILAALE